MLSKILNFFFRPEPVPDYTDLVQILFEIQLILAKHSPVEKLDDVYLKLSRFLIKEKLTQNFTNQNLFNLLQYLQMAQFYYKKHDHLWERPLLVVVTEIRKYLKNRDITFTNFTESDCESNSGSESELDSLSEASQSISDISSSNFEESDYEEDFEIDEAVETETEEIIPQKTELQHNINDFVNSGLFLRRRF